MKFVTVRWGDKYGPEYVYALQAGIQRYYSLPHEFVCITSQSLPAVNCIPEMDPWPGWWQKVSAFRLDGPFCLIDLDMVIVGSIDWLADYAECDLAAILNWGVNGGGCLYSDEIAGAVVVSNGRNPQVADAMSDAVIRRLDPHGDQTFLTEQFRGRITYMPQERICSYKRHVRDTGRIPDAASIVAFHGSPRPHEVGWVSAA